ncbi:TOBE domain-containing protein, partial [Natrinema salifodinae]
GDSDGDGDGGLATGDGEYARVAVDGEPFALPALPDVGDAERVTFCVRPGALSPTADRNRLTVTVETTEFLGETVRVNGRWNGSEIALRLPDVPDGDELTVGFAPEDVHVVSTR